MVERKLTKALLKEQVEQAINALRRQRQELTVMNELVKDNPEAHRMLVNCKVDGYLAAMALGHDLVAEEMAKENE